MGFQGEDKILFYTIMGIYSEVIVFIALIPFLGIIYAVSFLGASIPLTLFSVNYYKLTLYKKLREEVGAIPFWTGWLISKTGDWHYRDFGVMEKEEIIITDQDLDEYEKQVTFKEAFEKVKEDNEDLTDIIDEKELNDQFVDKTLSQEYQMLELVTSRQIYYFELLKVFFSINDVDVQKILERFSDEKVKVDPKNLNVFEQILYNIIMLKATKKSMTELTNYLEKILHHYGITDKLLYNETLYKKNLLQLKNVEYIRKDVNDVKKETLKNATPLIFSLVTCFITLFLFVYIKTSVIDYIIENQAINNNSVIGMNILYGISFIPMIIGMLVAFYRYKKINIESNQPFAIKFENTMNKRFAFENYCEIRKRMKEYSSDARLYKIFPFQKYRKWWDNDYFFVILPSSYEESLSFDISHVSHKGYPIEAMTTPIVMLDIGTLLGMQIYLMVACTYHFKRLTKVFYSYNLLQNWKNKIYLYLISTLQSKIQLVDIEKQTLKIRVREWQDWAIDQAQQFAVEREKRMQELSKMQRTPRTQVEGYAENGDEKQQENTTTPDTTQVPLNQKKRIYIGIIVTIVIIIFAIILFQVIIPMTITPPTDTPQSAGLNILNRGFGKSVINMLRLISHVTK